MPFKKIDVKSIIEEKIKDDPEFAEMYKEINRTNLAKQMIFDVAMEIQYKAEKLSDEEMVNKLLHALKLLDETDLEGE